MKIILIDIYDCFTFNLYHYISVFSSNVDVESNDIDEAKQTNEKICEKLLVKQITEKFNYQILD